MNCPNCGERVNGNNSYCTNCGARLPQTMLDAPQYPQYPQYQTKQGMDRRLQFTLGAVIGFLLYRALGYGLTLCVGRYMGVYALVTVSCSMRFLNIIMVAALLVEAIIMFAVESKNGISMAAMIAGTAAEVLIIVCGLAFPRDIVSVFSGSLEAGAFGTTFLRPMALAALVSSAAAFWMGYSLKKNSIKWDVIILGAAFLLALILEIFGAISMTAGYGMLLCGIGIGLIHPMVLIIPCSGRLPSCNQPGDQMAAAAPGSQPQMLNAPGNVPCAYKFCPNCNGIYGIDAVVCSRCNRELLPVLNTAGSYKVPDKRSFGFGLLGFLLPLLGFILWLVWHDTYPLRSKSVGLGALISVLLAVLATGFIILLAVGGLLMW